MGPNLLNTVKDIGRLQTIAGVLAKHGFGEVVTRTGLGSLLAGVRRAEPPPRPKTGERIRCVLQDLGPSFIKLGQVASTRPDVIPADIVAELAKLQDEVPPAPYEEIRPLIESELGAPLDTIFEDFDPVPLASASIGQVHKATLKSTEGKVPVAVKVQRPGVKELIELDVDLLYWLAHAIERSIPEARLYQPVKMVAEFDRAVNAELDFAMEADHAERFARNFDGKKNVKFPRVYREASSRRVLTLEFLSGRKVDQACLEGGYEGEKIAKIALDAIIQMVFEDGFFHADPHPGNLFVLGDPDAPVLGFLDLGLVGHLTPTLRDRTIDLMVAAVREDFRGIADALWTIGRPTKKVDRQAFEAEVTVLAQKYLGKNLGEIEVGMLLRDLVDGARRYAIEVPEGFLMMGKALMTIEGIGKTIHPDLDVFTEVRPYFLRLVQLRYSPEKITQDVLRGVMRLSNAAGEMPLQLQEILEDLRRGAFSVEVRETSLRSAADKLGKRFFSGLVVASLILGGAILMSSGDRTLGGTMVGTGALYGVLHGMFLAVFGGRR
ncbi:MAG: AarF/ABC1/UbiB kinase family protein [Myxococcota bacterium]